MQIITKVGSETNLENKKICKDFFLQFFLQGLKPKRGIFAGTKTIFLKLITNEYILAYL